MIEFEKAVQKEEAGIDIYLPLETDAKCGDVRDFPDELPVVERSKCEEESDSTSSTILTHSVPGQEGESLNEDDVNLLTGRRPSYESSERTYTHY